MSNPSDMARPGTPLTAAERRALEAWKRLGTKGAAAALGRSPRTIENQLATARVRLGTTTSHEAYDRARTKDDAA